MKELTKEQLYKKNQKRAKTFSVLSPIVFWVGLALAIVCFAVCFKNSFGNLSEICDKLDTKVYNDQQIAENYTYLTEKYGEWVIGSGSGGFTLVFVNVKNAVFSVMSIASGILGLIFLLGAFALGKWLFPLLNKKILQDNQDFVNIEILKKV